MRRSLLLALPACLLAITLPACGGDDDSSGPLEAGLAYLPADSPFAMSIDTELDGDQYKALDSILGKFPFGDQTVKQLIAEQVAGTDSGVNFEEDVEPILGNPFVVGALDVASFIGDQQSDDFVAALQSDDQEALDDLVDKTGAERTSETAGATKYEDDGTVFAVDGDVVVLAGSEEALDRALERADGDDHLTQDQYQAAFDGLPDAALALVYADLEELIGRDPEARQARKVEWVDALRTLGLTASASDDGLEMQFNVRTDPDGLTDADLPMATGDESPPAIARAGEIGIGLRDLSQLIGFAEAAGQSIDPSGFGDYEQAKQTLDSRLGVSIDDDLIGRLRGDMAGSVSLDGEFGLRAEVENPAAFEKTLAKIAKVLPASSAGDGLFRLGGSDGDLAVTGVVDGVFVVASDPERAREIARETPEEVDGAEGALAVRSDAQALANVLIRRHGPGGVEGFGAQLFTGPLEDLTGSMSADTHGLRGRVQLAVE
ncbi:MAG TPA: DUF3352 domain-containing protein [Thermoleophilaceae bacterium]|jgi:Protein of unknown function (DUF3352)|nr:DUF3352 domain-containing protein [Thermoleophilaceae bacterium]